MPKQEVVGVLKSLAEGLRAAMPIQPRTHKIRRQRIQPPEKGPNRCGWIPALQSEWTALRREGHQLPMQDQTGESRVYVLPRIAAEEQQRFDKTFEKTKTLSFLPPQIIAMGGPATAVHTVLLPELLSEASSGEACVPEAVGISLPSPPSDCLRQFFSRAISGQRRGTSQP